MPALYRYRCCPEPTPSPTAFAPIDVQAVNHGIPSALLDSVVSKGRDMFSLPKAQKAKFKVGMHAIDAARINTLIHPFLVFMFRNKMNLYLQQPLDRVSIISTKHTHYALEYKSFCFHCFEGCHQPRWIPCVHEAHTFVGSMARCDETEHLSLRQFAVCTTGPHDSVSLLCVACVYDGI